ncbi:1-deoxy-D-xylulose-5-phosphate synthase [Rhodobacterales bacterium HTCC2150]|nr:1-deoxy-D-xylulose-5-phosphate synthase [Rhodobacterales bacterium HTCC2150] [Rhodobacteraceae bacterium HTCC2150]
MNLKDLKRMKLSLLAATISLFSINPLSAGGLSDPIVVPVMSPSEVEVTTSSRGGFWLGAFFVLLIIGASGPKGAAMPILPL